MNSTLMSSFAPVSPSNEAGIHPIASSSDGTDSLNWTGEAALKSHYAEFVHPHAQDFELKRKAAIQSARTRAKIIMPIAGLLICAIVWLGYAHLPKNFDGVKFIFLACGAIGFVAWILIGKPVSHYKGQVKATVYPKIFAFFGRDFEYSSKSPIKMADLEWSDIVPSHSDADMEDYVKGLYSGVSIELVEARLRKQKGFGKSSRTVTVFDGVCIVLGMNKQFSGKTIVRRDAGKVSNWFKNTFNSLEHVALEDPRFERAFEVLSNDQVEARYLLSTTFMEQLMELQNLYGGTSIEASFSNNKLLLMISCKHNHFEASSIRDEATFQQETQTIVQEMRSIFGIVDILKLNERTGL